MCIQITLAPYSSGCVPIVASATKCSTSIPSIYFVFAVTKTDWLTDDKLFWDGLRWKFVMIYLQIYRDTLTLK